MTSFELRPSISVAQTQATQIVWAGTNEAGDVWANVSPTLREFGVVPAGAIDLVRLATAAYVGDQKSPRPLSFSRSIELQVHLIDATRWSDDRLATLCDLLTSLTGDTWSIQALVDASPRDNAPVQAVMAASSVSLLSGGLDSFCGAVLAEHREDRAFLGHSDTKTTSAAQNAVRGWFDSIGQPLNFTMVRVGLSSGKVDHSMRSRSFLFMALATAMAGARGATTVEVPENGFTSLNPPLGPERGGALSTRSTHPMTIARFNSLVSEIGLGVTVSNPYAIITKGELVALANGRLPETFAAGAAKTFSCAKLNGQTFLGGSAYAQCGLCFACAVRRAAFRQANVPDATEYLTERLAGPALAALRAKRAGDINALELAIERGFDEIGLLSLAPFPPGFDFDGALDLCNRGFSELAAQLVG